MRGLAEAIGLTLFAVMLQADVALGIEIIRELCAESTIHRDLQFVAFALDTVQIPVIALKCLAGSFAERGAGF